MHMGNPIHSNELKISHEIEFHCKPFDPNSIKEEGKKISTFNKFRKSIRMLDRRMDELDIIESSEILTKLVKGDALDVIYKDNPTDSTFKESLVKLDKQYLSKSLGIRDLYHQLKNLPNLHQTQSKQVNKTVTMALNLIENWVSNYYEIILYKKYITIWFNKFFVHLLL